MTEAHLRWPQVITHSGQRVRVSLWPAVQASIAAALAWFVAHRALGHPQPFFAPIAAAVAMSTSNFGRSRRAVQMVVGVLLGIGVAGLLAAALGTSTGALGLMVLVTILVALALGGGVFGEGMMFVNQAAASAILVVTLRRHGTGAERALDALVGGGSALLVGVIVFPAAPLPRLWAAERGVLDSLADALEHLSALAADKLPPDPEWVVSAGYGIHDKLRVLADARVRARANVRIAPRRWRLRGRVSSEDLRISHFDLLANAVLSLVRTFAAALEQGQPIPARLADQIRGLGSALRQLEQTPQPWPEPLLRKIAADARDAVGDGAVQRTDRTPMIRVVLHAAARDLLAVIAVDPASQ